MRVGCFLCFDELHKRNKTHKEVLWGVKGNSAVIRHRSAHITTLQILPEHSVEIYMQFWQEKKL